MWFGKRAVAVASYLGGFYYNTKLVPANMVPHSLYDLLKPEWKGKIATPQIEGAQANFLTLPSGLGGDATLKFFGDFAKQVGGLIRCGTSDRVASGEFWIFGYDCGDGEARLAQRKGQPLAEFYPKEGTSLNYYAPGIPRTAAHPMAARMLIAYMLTPAGQATLWNIMGLDYHKLPGSHLAAIIAEQRRKGTKIIEAYGLDATHPELDRYEKQIGDLVAQAH
jgi:iron(III) transport system substrate-binding protein